MSIDSREFKAALQSYVRKEEDGGTRDERNRILKGMLAVGAKQFDLMSEHDLAAALSVCCRPNGDKVLCGDPEVRQYLDEIAALDPRFERHLSRVLSKGLQDGDLSHLIWRDKGLVPKPADVILESPVSEPPPAVAEPGSLFDSHAEGE